MVDLTRRDFLSACSVLGASLAFHCSSAGNQASTAAEFLVNPSVDEYGPALDALIETVLPVTGGRFPLDRANVEKRLFRMFPLEAERRFLGFQKTLVYFDSLDLAPHVAPPLLQSERIAMDVPMRMTEREFEKVIAERTAAEEAACREFFARYGTAKRHFAQLPEDARLAWLRLWNGSHFAVKRDFAHTVRTIIFVSAYSSDRVWEAIGYEGPLVGGTERGS